MTVELTRASERSTTGPTRGELRGTGALVRLALRRDRWLLPSWIAVFALIPASSAAATAGLYPDVSARIEAANTVNATAAIVALYGRIYDPSSLGALALFKPAVFGTVAVAIVVVMLVVRHTRAEEETGRLELVGAGVVGRAAPLTASLLVAGGACLALGMITAVALVAAGLPIAGAVAFGAGWAATGMFFAAVAAVAAQLTTAARAATGLGLMTVAVAYLLRAVGDLAAAGPGWVSWLSPIGWNQQVRAFAGERWEVLLLPLLATALLLPVSFALRRRRDLGSGLWVDRPGPARGRLGTPWGLAWRLQRPLLLAWAVALVVLSTVLGSIANNVSSLLDSPNLAAIIEQLGGSQGLTDAFLAAEMGVLGAIAAAFGIVAATRLRTEETGGHAEVLLAGAAGRRQLAGSHAVIALGGTAGLLLVSGVAAGVGHSLAIGDGGQVLRVTAAAGARIPAAWVVVGLVMLVWGVWPRATSAVWALYVAFLVVGELGPVWGLPRAVIDLSPFAHSPLLPGTDVGLASLGWLTAVAALLIAIGIGAFQRRDVTP